MSLSKSQRDNSLENNVHKNSNDIMELKEDVGMIKKDVGKITKFINKELAKNNLCSVHDHKLKEIDEKLAELEKHNYVKARNGSSKKTLRPITDVLAETHEAIYWMKPIGLLAMGVYDFVRKHKIWSSIIGACLLIFHDMFFKFLGNVLLQPGNLLKLILEKYLG